MKEKDYTDLVEEFKKLSQESQKQNYQYCPNYCPHCGRPYWQEQLPCYPTYPTYPYIVWC